MARRGRGEGSIFKRSDGRWSAKLSIGRDDRGRLLQKTVYGRTRREAAEKLDKLKAELASGALAGSSKQTVADWLDSWLTNSVEPNCRESTRVDYEGVCRNHLKTDPVAKVRLSDLDADHVEKLLARLRGAGKSDRIIRKAYSVLRRSLNIALKRRLISQNPCQLVDGPSYDAGEAKSLSPNEVQTLLESAAGDRYRPLLVMAITTGARQGELLGLEWPNVDLEKQTVRIARAQSEIGGHLAFGPTKSKAGARTISIDPFTVAALTEHRDRMITEGFFDPNGLVFLSPQGHPVRRSNLRATFWLPLLKETGIKAKWHELRHSAASWLIESGIDAKTVSERLGHSNVQVTLSTYSHVSPASDRRAAGILGSKLEQVSGETSDT